MSSPLLISKLSQPAICFLNKKKEQFRYYNLLLLLSFLLQKVTGIDQYTLHTKKRGTILTQRTQIQV